MHKARCPLDQGSAVGSDSGLERPDNEGGANDAALPASLAPIGDQSLGCVAILDTQRMLISPLSAHEGTQRREYAHAERRSPAGMSWKTGTQRPSPRTFVPAACRKAFVFRTLQRSQSPGEYGGQGWIRTSVRKPGQIYSLLPLTTRPPVHWGPLWEAVQWRNEACLSMPVMGKAPS